MGERSSAALLTLVASLALLAFSACDCRSQGSSSGTLPTASTSALPPATASAPPPATASAPPAASSAAIEPGKPACGEAWASVPVPQRTYDFAADAKLTERGNEGYKSFADRLPRRGCLKDWTVLIYMAADAADLVPSAYRNIEAIESAGSTVNTDILVHLDLKAPPGIRRLHLFGAPPPGATTTTAGKVPPIAARTPRDIRSPIVELEESESTPPAESLTRFLEWGIQGYPSRRYMVIMWGHGRGWRRRGAKDAHERGGIALDESQRTILDIPSLHDALAEASKSGLGGRPFDIYAADACLMQSLEVDGEIASDARYIVGSEQIEPYVGLPYRTFLQALNGSVPFPPAAACEKDDIACAAAAALPRLAAEAFKEAETKEDQATYTLSTIDTKALTVSLYPELRLLSSAITEYVRETPSRATLFGNQLMLNSRLTAREQDPMPQFWGGERDLGVLLRRIDLIVQTDAASSKATAKGDALREAVQRTSAALQGTVIASAFGSRYSAEAYTGKAGVSVWAPHDAAELRGNVAIFAPSRFYEANRWQDWIEAAFTPARRAP